MSVKTAGVGHFTIPTAPAAGTSCTSGAANVFTTNYVQLIASTSAALYITGIYVEEAAVTASTYIVVQLATGAAASETIIGQYVIAPQTGSTVTRNYRPIFPPIPVATATRIAVKTADSVGAKATLITLECIAQSNVVDDAIPITTVTTVTNQLTAAQIATGIWQDTIASDFTTALSVGKSVMNGVTLGTGLTVASVSGAVGSVTGAVGSVTGSVGSVTGAVGSVTGNVGGNVVGSVASVTAAIVLPTIPTDWITAAGIATDAFGALELAAGAGSEIATAVRTELTVELARMDAAISSRMATYAQPTGFLAATFTNLSDVWKRLGLDSANPLINTDTAITAGAGVQITVAKTATQTTLTRS